MSNNQKIWMAIFSVIVLIIVSILILFHLEKEYLIAAIGAVTIGVGSLAIGIWHEFRWWMRADWNRGQGIVVGHRFSDGSYYEEVEFLQQDELVRFVSDYGSDSRPEIGASVDIVIDPSNGEQSEIYSSVNRWLFTFVPVIFAIIFISIGLNVEPVEKAPNVEKNKPIDVRVN